MTTITTIKEKMKPKPFIDMTNEQEVIREANQIFDGDQYKAETIEQALNMFVHNGEYDEIVSIEGNEPENAVRISDWILWTDSQGNQTAFQYENEETASHLIECYDKGIENPGV